MMEQPVTMEAVACPMGCRGHDVFLFNARDRLYGNPGEFGIVRCSACGLIRTNPRPTPSSMPAYYPADYAPYVDSRVRSVPARRRNVLRRIGSEVFRRAIRFNSDAIPDLRPGRLLEVGCASGAFLARMQALGWDAEGIEFSDAAAEQARRAGLSVQTSTLEAAVAQDDSFDLIVGWMIVEHLHSPVEGLAKLLRWARPGAWLCISVPNTGSYEFAAFKAAWYALHLPNHLYHFDPKTVRAVLRSAGWRTEKILHQRTLIDLIGSSANWLEDRGAPASVHGRLRRFPETSGMTGALALYPLASLLSLFGQTGRMTIWARKPDRTT